jgi:hypothetical protein
MAATSLLEYLPAAVRYERRELPVEQNALGPWTEAIACMRDCDKNDRTCDELIYGVWGWEDVQPAAIPKGDERARIDELLRENSRAFELVDEGIARGRLQFPAQQRGDIGMTSGRYIFPVRAIGRLRCIRAKFLWADGKLDSAAAEYAAIWRMGQLICSGEGRVTECIGGGWLRNAGLDGLELSDVAAATSGTIVADLAEEAAREATTAGGIADALRCNCCDYELPWAAKLPDGATASTLLEPFLEYFYSDSPDDEEPIPENILRRRLATRRGQLVALLDGHPRLFDLPATVQKIGEMTMRSIKDLERDPESMAEKLRRRTSRWSYRWLEREAYALYCAWPSSLTPWTSVELIGDDDLAVATRAAQLSGMRASIAAQYDPVPDQMIPTFRKRLRKIDNPVGKMVALQLAPIDCRSFVWRYRRNLGATLLAIRRVRRRAS